MTGIIHLFWSVATGHGPAGALLAWLTLCGAVDVGARVLTWLTDRAASLAWAFRSGRDQPESVVPLERAHSDVPAGTSDPPAERD